MSSQTVPSSVHFGCLRAPLPPPLRSAGVQFHPKGNALRILRSQGLCNEAIHRVYRSVIVGKLLYAVIVPGGVLPLLLTGIAWRHL